MRGEGEGWGEGWGWAQPAWAAKEWWSYGGAVVEPVHLAWRDGAQPVDELRQIVTLDTHGVAPDVEHLG